MNKHSSITVGNLSNLKGPSLRSEWHRSKTPDLGTQNKKKQVLQKIQQSEHQSLKNEEERNRDLREEDRESSEVHLTGRIYSQPKQAIVSPQLNAALPQSRRNSTHSFPMPLRAKKKKSRRQHPSNKIEHEISKNYLNIKKMDLSKQAKKGENGFRSEKNMKVDASKDATTNTN